eukprot:COSAG02_NODE_306_length_25175_cov_76.540118_15_plen_119_part_00
MDYMVKYDVLLGPGKKAIRIPNGDSWYTANGSSLSSYLNPTSANNLRLHVSKYVQAVSAESPPNPCVSTDSVQSVRSNPDDDSYDGASEALPQQTNEHSSTMHSRGPDSSRNGNRPIG